jgi:hypothetical protein
MSNNSKPKISKWIPLVRRLAKKRNSVNNIWSSEDLEQSAWEKILKYWHKFEGMTDLEIEKNIKTIFNNNTCDIVRSQIRRPDTHWSYKSNVMGPLEKTAARGSIVTPRPAGEVGPSAEASAEPSARLKIVGFHEGKGVASVVMTSGDRVLPGTFSFSQEEAAAPAKAKSKEIKPRTFRAEAGRFLGESQDPEQALLAGETLAAIIGWFDDRAFSAKRSLRRALAAEAGREEIERLEARISELAISRAIVDFLITPSSEGTQGASEPSVGRSVCRALGVPNSHWDRTVGDLRDFLSEEEAV